MEKLGALDFTSKMGQREFWITTLWYIGISIGLSIIYAGVYFLYFATGVANLFNGSMMSSEAPVMATVWTGLGIFVVLLFAMLYLHQLTTIVRRARDAGSAGFLTVVALLIPFGWIILGLIGSKK